LSIFTAGFIQFLVNDFTIYRRALIVTWLLHIILIGGSRFVWRVFRDRYMTTSEGKRRTLIVGAGEAGTMIARQLQNNPEGSDLFLVAFVDDDLSKQRMEIYGVPVLGRVDDIPKIVDEHQIDHVVIAIPSLGNKQLNEIVSLCNERDDKLRVIPSVEELMAGRVSVSHVRNVDVEDLLGRNPGQLGSDASKGYVRGDTVMVTGAGGSIGSELCRQLMHFAPDKLRLR